MAYCLAAADTSRTIDNQHITVGTFPLHHMATTGGVLAGNRVVDVDMMLGRRIIRRPTPQ